jgi:hypothetical protein
MLNDKVSIGNKKKKTKKNWYKSVLVFQIRDLGH